MIFLQHPPAVSCPSSMIPWIFDPLGVLQGTAVLSCIDDSRGITAFGVGVGEVLFFCGIVVDACLG